MVFKNSAYDIVSRPEEVYSLVGYNLNDKNIRKHKFKTFAEASRLIKEKEDSIKEALEKNELINGWRVEKPVTKALEDGSILIMHQR